MKEAAWRPVNTPVTLFYVISLPSAMINGSRKKYERFRTPVRPHKPIVDITTFLSDRIPDIATKYVATVFPFYSKRSAGIQFRNDYLS